MKNDKYYGSLRSRDNQWGVQFGFGQKSDYYNYYLQPLSKLIINEKGS